MSKTTERASITLLGALMDDYRILAEAEGNKVVTLIAEDLTRLWRSEEFAVRLARAQEVISAREAGLAKV